jgi:predicted dehydrogenase
MTGHDVRTLRAAVIGCGRIGSEFADDPRIGGVYTHAGAYASVPGVALVAVCDRDQGKARRCADRWGLPAAFSDVGIMLHDVRPDVVSVCTPDETHSAILEQVIASTHVRAVLAEKPLALDVDEAQRLVESARRRNVTLAVNYSRRYAPGHLRAKQLIDGGTLGELQKVSGFYTKGVRHNGTHWFDLARWLVGEVASVQGFDASQDTDSSDPTIDVRLTFASGTTAFVQGVVGDALSLFEMEIVGGAGRMRFRDSGHRVEVDMLGESPHYGGYRSFLPNDRWDGGLSDVLRTAVEDLVSSLGSGASPRCSGEDGVAALRIAAAAVSSARQAEPIDIATRPVIA